MNFLWSKKKFSMTNFHSLISPDFKGVVISKNINCMEIKLLEPIFLGRFPTVGIFRQNLEKGIFHGAKWNFL